MNGLLWKEWRENRLLVVWAALLTLVLLIGLIALNVADQSGAAGAVDKNTLDLCLDFIWCFFALLCSSAMMAPEIGADTLQFLSSLPISRKRIWWIKLLACLGVLALVLVASTLIYIVVYTLASQAGIMRSPLESAAADVWMQAPVALVTLPLVSLGMVVTMLMDRTISVLMSCMIASIVVYTMMFGVVTMPGSPWYNTSFAWLLLASLCIPIFLTMSYQTYLRGETLRTSARFKVAIPSFLQSVLIFAATLAIAYFWILA